METNVVVARFTGYATVTDMRYRWDYGQKLKVEGIADLPDYFEVHFSNAPSVGTAKVWLGQNGVVDIPDEYLATGEPVYAWIFLHAGETDGETVYSILIPVKKRPKPVNDAPTPVQKSELDTAIAILQTASATATEQATIATGAATTATEAAETATSAVADVEAAATRAEQAAEGAEASATDAQAAARSAELSAQTTQLAKSAAETAAANAEQSATDAGNYAGLAEAAEQDAQAAKTAAEASATAAAASETAAQTAQTSAEAAKDTAVANATTAATKAAEAAQSASSAADSETAAEAAATMAEQAAASLTVDSALSETSENPVQNKVVTGAVTDLKSATNEKGPVIMQTVTDQPIASFADGADDMPMKSVKVMIEPKLAGSGTPSPDNVRPISGWNAVTVTRCGVNVLHVTATSTTINGVTFTVNDDGSILANGTATALASLFISKTGITLNQNAILNGCPTGGGVSTYALQLNGLQLESGNGLTISANTNIVNIRIRIASGAVLDNVLFKPMIRPASVTDEAFVPYQGRSISVSWESEAGTVYGGTLDVVSGELVVDKGYIASYSGESIREPWISDRDAYTAGATPTTGAQVVYTLATPITYQLTPTEIRSLLGINNVFADTGDVTSVEYATDTKMYIDDKIAALQALVLENISNS